MGVLIEGVNKLGYVKRLSIRNNWVGPEALASLPPLLRRKEPNNLKHLILYDCRLHSQELAALFEELT